MNHRLVVLLAPGIGAELSGGLPRTPTRRAGLVVCPPASPSSLRATLLSGLPPRRVGSPAERIEAPAGVVEVASPEGVPKAFERPGTRVVLARDERFLRGEPTAAALSRFAREWSLDQVPRTGEVTLLVGGPTVTDAPRRVDFSELLDPEAMRVEGAVAWVSPPDGARAEELRRRLLELPGLERIVRGRALELVQAPTGPEWMLVAEPGWSFDGSGRAHGHFGARPALLAAWSESPLPPWSAAVHDWRVGESVLRALGRSAGHDTPLELDTATADSGAGELDDRGEQQDR